MKTATQSTSTCCEGSCQTGTVCRPRYFPRQIITPDELTLEQDYFRSRLRWHNLMLHGWGVVCGARVCPKRSEDGGLEPWSVVVERGYAIGPCGDEIILDCPRTVDLRTPGVSGVTGDPCVEPVDPWCSDVYEAPDNDKPLYIAIRYKETRTRPVRVQPVGCGCDDSRCEYSRWCDSYEIGVLTECPTPPMAVAGNGKSQPLPACPKQAASPWLGLAQVEVSVDGTVTRIDNCYCRRLVQSFGSFSWQCEAAGVSITAVDVTPPGPLGPDGKAKILATGSGFVDEMTVDLGPGVEVSNVTIATATQTIMFEVKIEEKPTPGPRTLTLTAPDCSVAKSDGVIMIETIPQMSVRSPTKESRRSPRRRRVEPRGSPEV